MDLLADYRRATMFFETGDPTGAARLLEPIVEAEPGNASVRQLLARAYFQSAQLNRAEEQLRELVDRDPSDHYAHHVLGRTLERLNRHGRAAAPAHRGGHVRGQRRLPTRWAGGEPGQRRPLTCARDGAGRPWRPRRPCRWRHGLTAAAVKLKLDLHDIFNKGQDIDRALRGIMDEAVAKKATLVEIIPGKGSGQLKKRVLRFLDQKDVKQLYHRVEKDSKNFGRLFVHFRWK